MKIQSVILTLILGFVFIPGVLALPGIPHQIYGSVNIESVAAPDGTAVQAKIGEDVYLTTSFGGKYGYSPHVLIVEDPDNNREGKTVEIYVNYKKVSEFVFNNNGYTKLDLVVTTSCGDGYCLGSETQATCPADCGGVPPNNNNGGGGGGGGGSGGGSGGSGGSYQGVVKQNTTQEVCIEQWECSEWGECKSGEQKRLCRDNNACKSDKLKPEETRTCVDAVTGEIQEPTGQDTNAGILGAVLGGAGSTIMWIVLGFVLLVIAAALVVFVVRKNRKN